MSIFDGISRPPGRRTGVVGGRGRRGGHRGITLVTGSAEPDNAAASSSAEPGTERGTAAVPTRRTAERRTVVLIPPDDTDVDDGPAADGDADQAGSDGTDDEVRDQPVAELEVPVRVNNSTIGGLAAEVRRPGRAGLERRGDRQHSPATSPPVPFTPPRNRQSPPPARWPRLRDEGRTRFDGIADASPGVIVIVTKDYEAARRRTPVRRARRTDVRKHPRQREQDSGSGRQRDRAYASISASCTGSSDGRTVCCACSRCRAVTSAAARDSRMAAKAASLISAAQSAAE